MRFAPIVWSLLAGVVAAQEPRTAAEVTEPGRTLARPLDMVLGGPGREAVERTLLVVLDASKGVADAGFADAFDKALADNRAMLQRTALGLAIVGADKPLVVAPTDDHAAVAREVRRRLQKPGDGYQNLFACLREVAIDGTRGKGERAVLLVSLENGDLEDDVEKTVKALAKGKVRVDVLTSTRTLPLARVPSIATSRRHANRFW